MRDPHYELELIQTEIGLLAEIWRKTTTTQEETHMILAKIMELQEKEKELQRKYPSENLAR